MNKYEYKNYSKYENYSKYKNPNNTTWNILLRNNLSLNMNMSIICDEYSQIYSNI